MANISKFKEKYKATFFLPTNEWCLPAPSGIKPEEREFVVDSGASMHMLSRKDLNSAELEIVRVFTSPTTVVAANGEVQTKEEATVYVRALDLFVTVMLLRRYTAVLSLGKLCEDHGYSFEWTSGQKPELIKDGRRIKCNTENFVPIVVPGLSTSSSAQLHLHLRHQDRRKRWFLHCLPYQQEVRVRVAQYGDTRRMNQQKTKKKQTKSVTTRPYGETRCVICQNGWKNSRKITWMKVFQLIGTHLRDLLVNHLQSREQKWYRASTVFILTSRRTEVATSACEPKIQGLRAEDAIVELYLEL